MNFLAHIYLSGDSLKIQIGNFIADSIKGKQFESFDDEIQKGIRLHRAIDAYTDQHPIVQQSTERLKETQKRYAPVAVDIFYDHFLAKNWENYHQEPLESFVNNFYENIQQYHDILPSEIQYMLPYMIRQNWLYNYQKMKGIERVFEGMNQRTSFQSNFLQAPQDLLTHYADFEQDFTLFFPELISFSKDFEKEI
ncbi:ACP phosphodiesterase [bacterium 336/3]|nr:ACP phosphodiesterase [bacterium 336/3]